MICQSDRCSVHTLVLRSGLNLRSEVCLDIINRQNDIAAGVALDRVNFHNLLGWIDLVGIPPLNSIGGVRLKTR
jgi:hypothetical protein